MAVLVGWQTLPLFLDLQHPICQSACPRFEAGIASSALPVLSTIAVTGLLGLLAILVIRKHPHLKVAFLWVSALVMLIASLLSIFSLGLYFLPASVLLLLAAIGVTKREEPQLTEAG